MERIVVVDDDPDILAVAEHRLRAAGYNVSTAPDGITGLQKIRAERPDVALIDLMMPGMHGFAVCQQIRKEPELQRTRIVVTSAKSYGADIQKAKEMGADAYLVKPYDLEQLIETVQTAIRGVGAALTVKFWGTRGSIPTPGAATMKYGGNTSCVEIRCGKLILMFDCGSGARELGLALTREFQDGDLHLHTFVSHTHWDHIQGFPFFTPAYAGGNHITLYSLRGADKSLEKVFTGQMDSTYFPVSLTDLKAHLHFVELQEPVVLGNVTVSYVFLNHPGLAVGFRVEAAGKSVVYVTDHEPYWRLSGENDYSRKLEREVDQFARNANLYIRDAQYTEDEYLIRRGWGHSTWRDALESAHCAGVKQLALYHHEPLHDDTFIDRIVTECQNFMAHRDMRFSCFAAAEKQELSI